MSNRRYRAQRKPAGQIPQIAEFESGTNRLADMTETDVIQAEIAGLEQGMLQLRLQQQEAAARLQQIDNAIQQQVGAIAAMQRLAQTMQARAAERKQTLQPVEDAAPVAAANDEAGREA